MVLVFLFRKYIIFRIVKICRSKIHISKTYVKVGISNVIYRSDGVRSENFNNAEKIIAYQSSLLNFMLFVFMKFLENKTEINIQSIFDGSDIVVKGKFCNPFNKRYFFFFF